MILICLLESVLEKQYPKSNVNGIWRWGLWDGGLDKIVKTKTRDGTVMVL